MKTRFSAQTCRDMLRGYTGQRPHLWGDHPHSVGQIRLLPVASSRDCPQRKEKTAPPPFKNQQRAKRKKDSTHGVSCLLVVLSFCLRRAESTHGGRVGGIFFYKAPWVCGPRPLSPFTRRLLGGCSCGRAPSAAAA